MAKLIFSPDARADLQEIWDYISDDSPFQADRFLERIRVKLEHIAKWNTLGRPRPELSRDCRSYPFEKYCFYFRPINEGIEVLHVLHSSRDIDEISFPE